MQRDLIELERMGDRLAGAPRQDGPEPDQPGRGARHDDVEARVPERRHDLRRHLLGRDLPHAARVGHAGGQLGADEVRHDDRHVDPGAAQLEAHRLGEADHAVLGRAVRRQARSRAAARERRDVDDVARAARHHAPHRLLRAVDHRAQIEVELAGDALRALLGQRGHGHDPGVVDEHVERPEALLDLVEERDQGRVVGDVDPEPEPAGAERGSRTLRQLAIQVAYRDARALARQRLGDRAADAAAASGDCHDLAGQRAWLLGH